MQGASAEETISRFNLKPHPFDGWFAPVETEKQNPVRFHYLSRAGEFAAWHKTAGQLILTHIDGAPLTLTLSKDGQQVENQRLENGSNASILVEAGWWRCWESLGFWSLLIVSIEKGSDFMDWELAPDNWYPG